MTLGTGVNAQQHDEIRRAYEAAQREMARAQRAMQDEQRRMLEEQRRQMARAQQEARRAVEQARTEQRRGMEEEARRSQERALQAAQDAARAGTQRAQAGRAQASRHAETTQARKSPQTPREAELEARVREARRGSKRWNTGAAAPLPLRPLRNVGSLLRVVRKVAAGTVERKAALTVASRCSTCRRRRRVCTSLRRARA